MRLFLIEQLVIEKDHEKLVEFKKRSFYYYQDWLNMMDIIMMYIKEMLSAYGKEGDIEEK